MPVVVRQGNQGRFVQIGSGRLVREHIHDQPDALSVGDVLFEWNGVDVSQFEAGPMYEGAGWGPTTLTVVADAIAPLGNVLRLATTAAGAATDAVIWLSRFALPLVDVRRYMVDCYIKDITDLEYGGLAWFADPAGGGHAVTTLQPTWQSRLDGGVLQSLPGLVGGRLAWNVAAVLSRSWKRLVIVGRKPAVGQPEAVISGWSGHDSTAGGGEESAMGWEIGQVAWPAPPASWNGLECRRWGLAVQKFGAAVGAQNLDVGFLRISVY